MFGFQVRAKGGSIRVVGRGSKAVLGVSRSLLLSVPSEVPTRKEEASRADVF